MRADDNILEIVREKDAEVVRNTQRGLILQPGAIGDCILTLPLAKFMKDSLRLGGLDILGHTEYISFLPGRTCVDGVRSIDSTDLHRLFVESRIFDLADGDPLISAFADYAWIVTFLGEPDSDFEQNLIFTANCSHSAEVITVPMKHPFGSELHLSDFYKQQFIEQSGLFLSEGIQPVDYLVRPTEADMNSGRVLLEENDVGPSENLVVIQPGSGGVHKCWHLYNFLGLAKELRSRDIEVIFLLGPAELARFSDIQISSIKTVAKCLTELSLTEVLYLLSCADVFIGNDSGITHLAAAMGLRTFVVFGPSNPTVYKPVGPAVKVFVNEGSPFTEEPSVGMQQRVIEALFS